MTRMTKYLLLAAALPTIALSAALAVAQDTRSMMHPGGMMGRGMDGCMQMMGDMHGRAQRPNEQWRQR
jgi:Spy/CpxP family protein refolding chaperone